MPQEHHATDLGVVSICAVVFLKALYKSNAGLCKSGGRSAGELVAGFVIEARRRLLQLDGSRSAGTTSTEAVLGRVRRFVRSGLASQA